MAKLFKPLYITNAHLIHVFFAKSFESTMYIIFFPFIIYFVEYHAKLPTDF